MKFKYSFPIALALTGLTLVCCTKDEIVTANPETEAIIDKEDTYENAIMAIGNCAAVPGLSLIHI